MLSDKRLGNIIKDLTYSSFRIDARYFDEDEDFIGKVKNLKVIPISRNSLGKLQKSCFTNGQAIYASPLPPKQNRTQNFLEVFLKKSKNWQLFSRKN